jgi:hypothetical protein
MELNGGEVIQMFRLNIHATKISRYENSNTTSQTFLPNCALQYLELSVQNESIHDKLVSNGIKIKLYFSNVIKYILPSSL